MSENGTNGRIADRVRSAEEERDRLLTALRHERERLQEIFSLTPAFIAVLRGPDFRFESANERYLDLIGRPDAVGRTVREVLPEVEGQGFLELLERVYNTGEPITGSEVSIDFTPDGGHETLRRYVNFVYQPLRESDGSVSGIFAHGFDVTPQVVARKAAEDAGRRIGFLAEASMILSSSLDYDDTLANLTRLVVSYLADWCTILLVEPDGSVVRVAAAHSDPARSGLAHEMLDLPPPTERTHEALFAVLDSGEPRVFDHVDEGFVPYLTLSDEQQALLRRVGIRSAMIVPLVSRKETVGAIFMARSDGGRAYGDEELELATELARRAAVAVDNTRLYRKTEALNQELERRVMERTKDLESFSYSVSHDLRAPLRGIDGFSLALKEEFGDDLGEEGRRYVDRIRAGSRRMAELIDDLLDLSRLTRTEKKAESVDLAGLATEILQGLERRDPERRVDLRIARGLVAEGDKRLLTVLLENLLENAWKFTQKRDGAYIEFGRTRTERGEAFFVRDNGAGFDMAYSERLFTAFQRLHAEKEYQGTGIGLATVRRIIDRHDGEIWAEGEVGRGATFYFRLGNAGAAG